MSNQEELNAKTPETPNKQKINTPKTSTPQLPNAKKNSERIQPSSTPTNTRITKPELALLLALWAEHKPDCETRRHEIERINKMKEESDERKQKYVFPSNAGVCVLDKSEKVIMVEGSGFTHAAVSVCARLPPHVLNGATVYISQFPCTMCVKVLLQANVHRIIVAEGQPFEFDRDDMIEESESEKSKLQKALKDLVVRAASVSNTGLSLQYSHTPHQRADLLKSMILILDSFTDFEKKYRFWVMGCAIIAAYRSEDSTLQVGACLAHCRCPLIGEKRGGSIIVYGVSYNGSIQKALELDFPKPEEKGKFSMHAEQNLFIYSSPHVPKECELYTTHSPCTQCAQLIAEYEISRTYYISQYKKEHFECYNLLGGSMAELLSGGDLVGVLPLLRGHSVKEVFDRLSANYDKEMKLIRDSTAKKKNLHSDYKLVREQLKQFLTAAVDKLTEAKKYMLFITWYKSADNARDTLNEVLPCESTDPSANSPAEWKEAIEDIMAATEKSLPGGSIDLFGDDVDDEVQPATPPVVTFLADDQQIQLDSSKT